MGRNYFLMLINKAQLDRLSLNTIWGDFNLKITDIILNKFELYNSMQS